MQRQLTVLEQLINKALRLEPNAQQRLASLQGKSLGIECYNPDIHIVILIEANSIQLLTMDNWLAQENGSITSHLTGDFSAFVKLLSAKDKAAALINSDLKLKGDSTLLLDVQNLLMTIGIDWEFHLARFVGDIPAHFLGELSRNSWRWLRNTQPVFIRHLKEFVTEEIAITPNQETLDDYIEQVQALEQRIDRLEAKIRLTAEKPVFAKGKIA